MNKQFPWKFSLIAFVILAAAYSFWPPYDSKDANGVVIPGKIKLGLDLKGGTSFLLKMDLSQIDAAGKGQAIRQAIEILERRVNKFGVSEPIIQSVGEDRILIQLPGLSEEVRADARRTIEQTAYLEFLLVNKDNDQLQAESGSPYFHPPLGYTNLAQDVKSAEGREATRHYFCKLKPEQGLTGKYVERAYVTYDDIGRPSISLTFNKDGATLFGRVTGANVGRQLAIVLDGEVKSAPVIQDAILGGRAQISGTFSIMEAQRLASVLENPLQAPVKVLEQRSVDPSLGMDSIHSGIRSALYGAIAVIAFMAIYYLLAGMVANAALVFNILITVGVLAAFKFTLTLPGIAGIVLSIGMAVDTNVLIYERVREELAAGKPLRAAIAAAYSRAFRVIFDAHFTAILTALILVWMGSGPVKGFGVTLVIGLLANL
ncbi:MAG: protein translocase subunit SecD, partial [Verrucomicrobiota bacterium]